MNELKILGVDANVYFKNIEFYIKNPRKTLFKTHESISLFHKHEYVNVKKEQGKIFMEKRFHDFHKAVKVIVSSREEAETICDGKFTLSVRKSAFNLSEDSFKPMFDNYVIIMPWNGNLFHIVGYWIRKQVDGDYYVSTFYVQNNILCFSPIDWLIRKSSLNKEPFFLKDAHRKCLQVIKQSLINHNKSIDKKYHYDIEEMMSFYGKYASPNLNFILKQATRTDYEITFRRMLNRLHYNQCTIIPHNIVGIVKNMNDLYEREEVKYFDYREEAVKRNDTNTAFYNYRIINLNKKNLTSTRYERSVNTNKWHRVRGFYRQYKSGKRAWINSHFRGDFNKGFIDKDYVT
tara:strand:- start:93 stop:1133 length:1041 start_codon:yes stop_codon:yes gene_type:complete